MQSKIYNIHPFFLTHETTARIQLENMFVTFNGELNKCNFYVRETGR